MALALTRSSCDTVSSWRDEAAADDADDDSEEAPPPPELNTNTRSLVTRMCRSSSPAKASSF